MLHLLLPGFLLWGATLLHNSPYKINSHMLSHGKSNNLLLQTKNVWGIYMYLQKCLFHLCMAELDLKNVHHFLFKAWRRGGGGKGGHANPRDLGGKGRLQPCCLLFHSMK